MLLKLNYLKTHEIYQQTLALAKSYCPEWSSQWPAHLDTNTDPGLVLLRLFSDLSEYVIQKINQVPDQRFLAYLSFMGLTLGNPLPAKVTLSFTSRSQGMDTLIVTNTAVASEVNPELFFYTQQALNVLPLSISVALFINPNQDSYIDQSQNVNNDQSSFVIFDNQDSQPLNHLLLLGDDVLFTPSPALQNLQITFSGNNLYKEYFTQWFDDVGNPLDVTFIESGDKKTLAIVFDNIMSLQNGNTLAISAQQVLNNLLANTATVGGVPATIETTEAGNYYWLSVKPAQGVKILKDYKNLLPEISIITCYTSGENIAPQVTLYNNLLLSSKNGVYPFSQMPQLQDAFYIGSNDVFDRNGAEVTLQFSILPAVSPDPKQPLTAELAWEYWDGQAWQDLSSYILQNDTNNFIATEETAKNPLNCMIQFLCPAMQLLLIAGQESLWIRGRIASGSYSIQVPVKVTVPTLQYSGYPTVVQADTDTTETVYYPPFIYSLNIDYKFTTSNIKQCLTHNNFSTSNLLNQPYIPVLDPFAAFYLGFSTETATINFADKVLTLFFPIQQSFALSSDFHFDPANSPIQWQYYDGYAWQNLIIIDETLGLKIPGIVSFKLPATWQPSVLFGQELLWIRFENQGVASPSTYGIYPNSVTALNATNVLNEVLGSSTGDPLQTFIFANTNILKGQTVAVIENKLINQEELNQLEVELGASAVKTVEIDGTEYIQVTWQEVPNFACSTPVSRHYVLNHQSGELLFGDGQQGMVPPKGVQNIIAVSYQTSLGVKGNSALNTIVHLQVANGQIQSVTNHMAAQEGSNGYAIATVESQGPSYIRSYDRAVVQNDYAALAVQASPLVLRAATQSIRGEQIGVYILANVDMPKPLASYALLEEVRQAICQQVYLPLQDRVVVRSANYLAINVVVQCYGNANVSPDVIANDIKTQLSIFLDPRYGGREKQGWDFGQSLSVTQLIALVQRIVGVSSIISITANGNNNQVNVSLDQLICCGMITTYVF